MTAVAIIVSARPDMLAVCRAALTRFAPWLPVRVVATSPEVRRWSELGNEECLCLPNPGRGARDHAAGIEYARTVGLARDADIVVLLDDDTVILSDRWWPWIETAFAVAPHLGILGGVRSRGLIGQAYVEGVLLVHAHMMAMRGDVFRRVSTFHARDDAEAGYVQVDTGGLACLETVRWGHEVRPVPFHEPGHGLLYAGIDATEYFAPPESEHPLWAHLGRGTSFAPQGWWREHARTVAAHIFGSPRAAKIIRRQDQRARFIARSWELVTEGKR